MSASDAIFNKEKVVAITKSEIDQLKAKATTAPRQVYRLCLHASPEAKLHEMLIVLPKDVYFKPHKHHGKSESFHIIEGALDVFLFDELGNITQKIEMGEYQTGKSFYYRLATPVFHTVVPKTPQVVFQETTDGPFVRSETEFCPWAPEENDAEGIRNFLLRLRNAQKIN